MWSTLDRTRRRLVGVVLRPALEFSAPSPGPGPEPVLEPIQPTGPTPEMVIAIGRPEFDRLGAALQTVLGPGTARPDTPDRLEAALADGIAGLGLTGRLRVSRRPAGLYTPEGWQVALTDAEPEVERAIRRAIREGVFAA